MQVNYDRIFIFGWIIPLKQSSDQSDSVIQDSSKVTPRLFI